MYPRGFHPGAPNLEYSGKYIAYPRQRRDAPGVRYYLTDFGISSQFDENDTYRLVTGKDCLDKTLPELSYDDPYDPFAVDIYLLGNVFKYAFVRVIVNNLISAVCSKDYFQEYKHVSFLEPLSIAMTQREPASRPTVADCFDILNDLVGHQTPRSLRRLIISYDSDKLNQFLRDIGTVKREIKVAIRSVFCTYS